MTFYMHRIKSIISLLETHSAYCIADFGCGDGKLVEYLQKDNKYKNIICVDKSIKHINKIKKRYNNSDVIKTINQSFFDYNPNFENLDAIIISEVIEHLHNEEIKFLFDLILNKYLPKILIITTPNRSYNHNFKNLYNGLRHSSHIFEFSEEELQCFIASIRKNYPNYNIFSKFCDPYKASHLIVIEKRN